MYNNVHIDDLPSITFDPLTMSVNNFDDFFEVDPFVQPQLPSVQKSAATLKPSDIDQKEQDIKMIINQADLLAELHSSYVEKYITRGNQALYELLSRMYSLAIQINISDYRDSILKQMRNHLSLQKKIKTQKNSTAMTMIVRWVLGSEASRQLAFTYSKALDAAASDNIAVDKVVEYFTNLGGINTAAKKNKTQVNEKIDFNKQEFDKFMRTSDTCSTSFKSRNIKWEDEVHGDMKSDHSLIMCFNNGGGNFQGLRAFNLTTDQHNKICKILADELFANKSNEEVTKFVANDLEIRGKISSDMNPL